MTRITSPQNPKIRQVIALRERRKRQQTGLTVVEGYDELSLALASGARIVELFYCPALFRDSGQAALIERTRQLGTLANEVDERLFEKIAYRENPDGWLATAAMRHRGLDDLRLGAVPFVLVAEAVEKPGNLGAMLRTADAAGVDAFILCDPLTDWGNPNVTRASKGAVFSVQIANAPSAETIAWLRARGIQLVVTTPQAATPYTHIDFRGPVAIAVGAEDEGLRALWLAHADHTVVIPMFGRVNSLNVATSAALLMYEVVRQRTAQPDARSERHRPS